jgi:hypothetical protein
MADKAAIEQQLRGLLAADLTHDAFFELVFSREQGLFRRLADTPEELRALGKTELWRLLISRQAELARRDLAFIPDMLRRLAAANPFPELVVTKPADDPPPG